MSPIARHEDAPTQPAATVLVVRDADRGLEVLMLRRSSTAAFAGGFHVFPGGRVDAADGAAAIATYCAGLDDDAASARLGLPEGGLAYWVAAVRECFEEAGVLIARRRDGAAAPLPDADERRAVHRGELSMVELCRRHDLVLELDRVPYVAHWVTPRGEPRRFDARFFLAAIADRQDAMHDEVETVGSDWLRPADALAAMHAGEWGLLPPTIANLAWLAPHADVAAAMAAATAAPLPVRIEPRLRFDSAGQLIGVAMPGDDGYDDLA